MIDAEIYSKITDFHKRANARALNQYGSLVKWKLVGGRILDIGCGEGPTTIDILLPLISDNVQDFSLTAIDLSDDMVSKAKNKCNEENINFEVMDIAADEVNGEFKECFDNIFSFFCLHLVANYKNWIKNTYSMLSPGGQVFLLITGKNPLSSETFKQSESEKWAKYMKNSKSVAAIPFCQLLKPDEWIHPLLVECGYKNIEYKFLKEDYAFENFDALKLFIRSFRVIYGDMPQEMHEEFLNEFTELVSQRCEKLNGKTDYHFQYNLILIVASK